MSECEYIKPNVEVFFALPCEWLYKNNPVKTINREHC
jgi:hypothetical protein